MAEFSTAQQNPGYVDYYDVEYPRRQINESDHAKTNPEPPKPRKTIVQDIYDEDGYCLARSSSKLTDDNIDRNVEYHNKQDIKQKQTRCLSKNSVGVSCVALLLIAIFGIVGVILHRTLYGEGSKDINPGTFNDNLQ